MRGNLSSLARGFDEAQKKSDKIQGRGSRADTSKLSSALSGVQEAGVQWESQAPFVFESLQALDESRVNHLRDALTQLQTHEVDVLERNRAAAASTLELILNVNTADEISAFVARNAEGAPSLQTPRRPTTTSQRPMTPIPSLAPPTPLDDRRSEISSLSGTPQSNTRAVVVPPPTQKKSAFGGLKRLGTVIGRRNKDATSSPKAEKPPPPERKTKTLRNPLRRNSTISDMQRIPSPNASAVELGDYSGGQASGYALNDTSRAASTDPAALQRSIEPHTNGNITQNAYLPADHLANGSSNQMPVEPQRQIRPTSTILEEGNPSALDINNRAQQEADAT